MVAAVERAVSGGGARAGVIFYEMLYGRRPFHTNVSQEAIATDNLLLHPTTLNFDAKPAVSQGAKDFIRQCLTYSHTARPDAREAARHEYLATARGARRGSAAAAGAQGLAAPDTVTASPLRVAPWPSGAEYSSSTTGAKIAPANGAPSWSTATEVHHPGRSYTKLTVPSIGSMCHSRPDVP